MRSVFNQIRGDVKEMTLSAGPHSVFAHLQFRLKFEEDSVWVLVGGDVKAVFAHACSGNVPASRRALMCTCNHRLLVSSD